MTSVIRIGCVKSSYSKQHNSFEPPPVNFTCKRARSRLRHDDRKMESMHFTRKSNRRALCQDVYVCVGVCASVMEISLFIGK